MKKILLINDSKFENIILKDMLKSIGYSADILNEKEAVAKVRELRPDCIIINRVMKGVYGDRLAAQIKGDYPHAKCILSSCNPINISEFNKGEIDAVMKTPIAKQDLKIILKDIEYKTKGVGHFVEDSSGCGLTCSSCRHPITSPDSINYKFCPFCGEKLEK